MYTSGVSTDIYARLAAATGFNWDDGNAPKVRARHEVEPGECEQAFFAHPLLVVADPAHSLVEQRWRALGQTLAGRQIYVVFTLRGALIRVIGARDLNRKERRLYEQAQASPETDSRL